jgi:hypothetical protein
MAATATPKKSADLSFSRRVLVQIRRDQTTETPRVVWAHEVPILQVIFGEGEVRQVETSAMDDGYKPKASADMMPHNKRQDPILPPSETAGLGYVFVGNAQAEYERLIAAYGRHVDVPQPNVEYVYGRFSRGDFARIVGRPSLDDLPDSQLRDLILSYGHHMPIATHDSTDAERAQAATAWADFRSMGHAELVKLAEQTGVEVG